MSALRPSAPHPAAAVLRSWKLDSFGELRGLRAALREAIETHTDEVDDLFDRMSVVATELATNALRHGLPPTEVRLMRESEHLILDVADHDLGTLPEVDRDRPLGAGGLGLQLTKTFAIDVGWYMTDTTKHVWASFPG
ncbi:ATP-binding protein [Actinoplanes bogorensis]|uniref:ATP-binding protein n=1 Tax=Paractinoplanes bogorensis TaxID=1610840 RepID=A0ABS5YWR2_9ACTN|nr:ATP-binding protein [Actinoplanes bogorensis]MBU2667506.1 ATP-binding protein [Actinoplanes bogorensis]